MLSFVALALIALVAAQPYRGVFLSNGGTTLSIFELDNVDRLATRPITGATTKLDAVDFRATDGALIGLQLTSTTTGAFFIVNPCTGVTTALMRTPAPVMGMAQPAVPVTYVLNPMGTMAVNPPAGNTDIDVNPLINGGASCEVRIYGGGVRVIVNTCSTAAVAGAPLLSALDIFASAVSYFPAPATPTTINLAGFAWSNNVNNGGAEQISTLSTPYAVDITTGSLYTGSSSFTRIGAVGALGTVAAGAGLDIFTDVTRVPGNRLLFKNANKLHELNPLNGAIIDTASIHEAPVAGEFGLAISRFTCTVAAAAGIRSSSDSSSDSSSSSSSSSTSSK